MTIAAYGSEARPAGRLSGQLLVVAAAVLWSSCGLFVKMPIFDAWPAGERGIVLAFWRALFAASLLAPMVRRPRWRPALLPLGLIFAAMSATYLAAMSLTTAANAIWLQSTAPWWVFCIGVLLLRERVARRDLVPLAFGVLGVGVILAFELRGQARLGVVFGLLAGLCYAGVVLLLRRLRAESTVWVVTVCHASTAALLLPWAVWLGVWPTGWQWLALVAFGGLQIALPYVLLARALRTISSQEAMGIALLEPVLTPLWSFAVRGEVPAVWTIVGAGLILTGLVLRYFLMPRFLSDAVVAEKSKA